jgi:DNA-binding NtrC family response regulator
MISSGICASILIADDEEGMRDVLYDILTLDGHSVTPFDPLSPDQRLLRKPYDVAILDMIMPGKDGFSLRDELKKYSPHTQIIFIASPPDAQKLETSIDQGAYSFLTKPFNTDQIRYSVFGALRMHRLMSGKVRNDAVDAMRGMGLVGESDAIARVREKIFRIAPLEVPVIITGGPGTGKEVAARCIHECSRRAKASFTVVNCAGLSPGLIESELFGRVRGAATGDAETKPGLFEVTDGGTLFLDEICALPAEVQGKVLRILGKGEYVREGDTAVRRADVRVLCAASRALDRMVTGRLFRKDLFLRLLGDHIELPCLAGRKEDIPALVRHFLGDDGCAIAAGAMSLLLNYDWPGNESELESVVAGLKAMAQDRVITQGMVLRIIG